MSDGFDKEAEREKLREKFADDEQQREHTQRMSELLLQGATMTNRHCDDCGDPIFRHDGQEFCPTCQAAGPDDVTESTGSPGDVTESTGSPGDETPGDTAQTDERSEASSTPPDAEQSPPDAEQSPPDAEQSRSTRASRHATAPNGANRDATGSNATPSNATGSNAPSSRSAEPSTAVSAGASPSESAGSDTVADARASLTRTLARFARAAEETDDPRRARDQLQAAREAAEALSALDR